MKRYITGLALYAGICVAMWLAGCFVAWQWIEIPPELLRIGVLLWPFLGVYYVMVCEFDDARAERWRKAHGSHQ